MSLSNNRKRQLIRAYFRLSSKPSVRDIPSDKAGNIRKFIIILFLFDIICVAIFLLYSNSVDIYTASDVGNTLVEIFGVINLVLISLLVIYTTYNYFKRQPTEDELRWKDSLQRLNLTEDEIEQLPENSTIDRWLKEDLQSATKIALKKLNLTESELVREPLVIYGPLLWSTYGISDEDITSKLGDDGKVRFSCYQIIIVMLSEERIATYSADFNFMRYTFTNERGVEFLYQDIVSVSTEEKSTNYSLPNGKKMKRAEIFRLAVSSGDNIEVVVGSREIKDLLGGEPQVSSHEQNVRVIREMLRDKKSAR